MKRDWDLIRKILLDIEENRNVIDNIPKTTRWSEHQPWEEYEQYVTRNREEERRVCGHLEMLCGGGIIDGLTVTRTIKNLEEGFRVSVSDPRLTIAGHDLLDAMRPHTVWEKIKSIAKSKGLELTIDCIKIIGASVAQTAFK